MSNMILKSRKVCFSRILVLSAALLLLMLSFPTAAFADMGPKPSVRITFSGLDESTACYGTLLSETDSTGPSSVWDGTEENAWYPEGEYEIWKAFVSYEDEDGFCFLQEFWNCSETGELSWTYYPPQTFKILLYYPETDTFSVSPVYERYAFDSYFSVNLSGVEEGGTFTAERSYDYTWEIISLVVRIAATIVLEMAVALLFGYRRKKALLFLTAVNAVTQIGLNAALNIICYQSGPLSFTMAFVPLEIAVFIVEALLYRKYLHRLCDLPQSGFRPVAYAFVANALSLAAGLWLAHVIPGMF